MTDEQYTYVHDPNAPSVVNYEESLKMDKVRATMGPTATEVKERAAKGRSELNGHKPFNGLDKRTPIC